MASKCGDPQYRLAIADLELACKLEPSNDAVRQDLHQALNCLRLFEKHAESKYVHELLVVSKRPPRLPTSPAAMKVGWPKRSLRS